MSLACAIQFRADGSGVCLNTDTISLQDLGTITPTRASHVEFNQAKQLWQVRFVDKPGKVVFSHTSRAECVRWEVATLNKRILGV